MAATELCPVLWLTGGATKTISVPKPKTGSEMTRTKPEVIQEIDRLLDQHIDREVAATLNERGFRSSVRGLLFDANKLLPSGANTILRVVMSDCVKKVC